MPDPATASPAHDTPHWVNAARQQQQEMRDLLRDHELSIAGLAEIVHIVRFLCEPAQHLGPGFVRDTVRELGTRPNLHLLRRDLSLLVRMANKRYRKPLPAEHFNQLRFSKPDELGMTLFTGHCNAEAASRILNTIRDYREQFPQRITPGLNTPAADFQALTQLLEIGARSAFLSGDADSDTEDGQCSALEVSAGKRQRPDVGVVITLEELRKLQADADQRVKTTLGTTWAWRDLQAGTPTPIDWVAIIGDQGLEVKQYSSERFATPQQRTITALASPYCAYPGCGVRAADAQAHHVKPWGDGGRTEPANLAFLCKHHHSQHDDTRTQPGGFHVELDAYNIPFVVFHPLTEGGVTPKPAYNRRNLNEAPIVRALRGGSWGCA